MINTLITKLNYKYDLLILKCMHMCVCMHMCRCACILKSICVCEHVCICTCVYICVCVHMQVCVHACISVYVHVQICVCAYVCEDMPPCTYEGQMKTLGVNPHLFCLVQVSLCFSVARTGQLAQELSGIIYTYYLPQQHQDTG